MWRNPGKWAWAYGQVSGSFGLLSPPLDSVMKIVEVEVEAMLKEVQEESGLRVTEGERHTLDTLL